MVHGAQALRALPRRDTALWPARERATSTDGRYGRRYRGWRYLQGAGRALHRTQAVHLGGFPASLAQTPLVPALPPVSAQSHPLHDFFITWCCAYCALCQEARELVVRGAAEREGGRGWWWYR